MDDLTCKPLSINAIRKLSNLMRSKMGISIHDPIDMRIMLDEMSCFTDNDIFEYEIVDDLDPRFSGRTEAFLDIYKNKIYIKESTFDSIEKNIYSRGTFTIAHEIGHYVLHGIRGLNLLRSTKKQKIYESAEWQANQFAAELLMPYEGVIGLTPNEIKIKYRVSSKAAEKRYEKVNHQSTKQVNLKLEEGGNVNG